VSALALLNSLLAALAAAAASPEINVLLRARRLLAGGVDPGESCVLGLLLFVPAAAAAAVASVSTSSLPLPVALVLPTAEITVEKRRFD
jgi:hypothetical protein